MYSSPNFAAMKRINASIITIGDELLIGQTLDTNSAWMAEELNKIGVWVKRRVAVGDAWDDIWNALDEERKQADIILITGGLGPTADDITKPLLCKYFGGKLVTNEQVLAHVKYLFEKVFRRPGPILERNAKQAEVPDVCTVLMNERGTAPGMWFTQTADRVPPSALSDAIGPWPTVSAMAQGEATRNLPLSVSSMTFLTASEYFFSFNSSLLFHAASISSFNSIIASIFFCDREVNLGHKML